MANIFDLPNRYITIQEVRDTTTKTNLQALTDNQINILISKAEFVIDNFLGYKIELNDQNRQDLKIACFYVLEQIFENGDLIQATSKAGTIKSERAGDVQYIYNNDNLDLLKYNQYLILGIPEEALNILKKYKNYFFKKSL